MNRSNYRISSLEIPTLSFPPTPEEQTIAFDFIERAVDELALGALEKSITLFNQSVKQCHNAGPAYLENENDMLYLLSCATSGVGQILMARK